MDAKLKALKVVDLKAILTAANVHVPAKANKQDLIAKIIASQPAREAYFSLHEPHELSEPADALEELPEDPTPAADPPKPTIPLVPNSPPPANSLPPIASTHATTPTVTDAKPSSNTEDPELEKRRQRAARFGIPLVEPKQASSRSAAASTTPIARGVLDTVLFDEEKLKTRAARFGITSPSNPQSKVSPASPAEPARPPKRAAQEQVDPEELERRRKRAERFGVPVKS